MKELFSLLLQHPATSVCATRSGACGRPRHWGLSSLALFAYTYS
jgi:hypothetical protein